jgi:hypothetical protein
VRGLPSRGERNRTVAAVVVALLATLAATAATADAAGFRARGSIDEAYVLAAKKGQRLQLLNRRGKVVAAGRADRFGSKIFRLLEPGRGYSVRRRQGGRWRRSRPFKVLRPGDNPRPSFYQHKG